MTEQIYDIRDARARISSLIAHNADLEKKNGEKDKQIATMKDELDQWRKEGDHIDEFKAKIAELERQLLIRPTTDEIQARADLWDRVIGIVRQYKGYLGNVDKMLEAINEAFSKFQDSQEQLKLANEILEDILTELDCLSRERMLGAIKGIKASLSGLEGENEDLTNQLERFKKLVEQVSGIPWNFFNKDNIIDDEQIQKDYGVNPYGQKDEKKWSKLREELDEVNAVIEFAGNQEGVDWREVYANRPRKELKPKFVPNEDERWICEKCSSLNIDYIDPGCDSGKSVFWRCLKCNAVFYEEPRRVPASKHVP